MKKLEIWKSSMFWQICILQLVVIILLFFTLYYSSKVILSHEAKDSSKQMTSKTAERMEKQAMELASHIDSMTKYIKISSDYRSDNLYTLNAQLRQLVTLSPIFSGGTVVNVDGDVLGFYPSNLSQVKNLKDRKYINEAIRTKQVYYSDVIRAKTGRDLIVIAIPLINQGKVERVVNLSINLNEKDSILHALFSELNLGEESYVYIVDRSGKIVFHPDKTRIGDDVTANEVVQKVIQKQTGYQRVTNTQGIPMYASYDYVKQFDWGIVAQVPVATTYQTAEDFQEILLPIGIILTIILFIILVVMAGRMIYPLRKLTCVVDQVTQGDYEQRVTGVKEHTEIGELASKFNRMIETIHEKRQELEENGKQLNRQKDFLAKVMKYNPNGIYAMDSYGVYTFANQAYANYFGVDPEDIIGKKEADLNSNKEQALAYSKVNQDIIAGHIPQMFDDNLIDADGVERWLQVVKVPITGHSPEEPQLLCVVTDITERKQQEEKIKYQVYHDDLTGLPNKKMFKETLKTEMADLGNGEMLAVAFIDLDRFKQVNDTFGHDVGDQFLKIISRRLKRSIRFQDIVFRASGDEFMIILSKLSSKKEAAQVAKKLMEDISSPYEVEGNKFVITASIGISMCPEDGVDNVTLLKQADIAMYQAKEQGRNTYRFYNVTLESDAYQKLRLETQLHDAIENDRFSLHYQPKINILTGKVLGIEALIRWEDDVLGMVSPVEFIPIAEEKGLITKIGEWVLRKACAQTKIWCDQGMLFKVAVNISPLQLDDPDFIDKVETILTETELPPFLLELEVTESTIMKNQKQVNSILKRLRKKGISIAIDDFGIGYSSLNVLKRLTFDTLKIDRDFIGQGFDIEKEDPVLAAIFQMAENLHLHVVAEGVESEEQLAYLQKQYCHEVQGFLFGQPLPAEKLILYLQQKEMLKI